MVNLPNLQNYLVPPAFRENGPCYGVNSPGGEVLDATSMCVRNAIIYYIHRLFELVVIVAVVYTIYAGVIMITSIGDESKFTTAKKTLLYALIGLAIAIMALVIVNFVVNILGGNAVNLTSV